MASDDDDDESKAEGRAFQTCSMSGQCLETSTVNDFISRSKLLVEHWSRVEKENFTELTPTLTNLLQMSKEIGVQKEWNSHSPESQSLLGSLSRISEKCVGDKLSLELSSLQELLINPWNNSVLVSLMAGQVDSLNKDKILDFLTFEGLSLTQVRIDVLLEMKFFRIGLNVLSSFVKVLPLFPSLTEHSAPVSKLLLSWLTLKSKFKDTSDLYLTMNHFPFSIVLQVLYDYPLRSSGKGRLGNTEFVYLELLTYCLDYLFSKRRNEMTTTKEEEEEKKTESEEEKDLKSAEILIDLWLNFIETHSLDFPLSTLYDYIRDSSSSALLIRSGMQILKRKKDCKKGFEISLSLLCVGMLHEINHQGNSSLLSESYVFLSTLFPQNLTFVRECILTAFSVQPSKELLRELERLAHLSGFTTDENKGIKKEENQNEEKTTTKSQTEKKTLSSSNLRQFFQESLLYFDETVRDFVFELESYQRIKSCWNSEKIHRNLEGFLLMEGHLLTESLNYDALSPPVSSLLTSSSSSEGEFQISPYLFSDLIILLSASRWHALSWIRHWSELHHLCNEILKDSSLRSVTKELKYLDIDTAQFDDWSSEEEDATGEVYETADESSANSCLITSQSRESGVSEPKRLKMMRKTSSEECTKLLSKVVPGLNGKDTHLLVPSSSVHLTIGMVSLSSCASDSHETLLRQLRAARSQGLVSLQKVGEQQVYVHRVSGKWIMRQGNKLVTVSPPTLLLKKEEESQRGEKHLLRVEKEKEKEEIKNNNEEEDDGQEDDGDEGETNKEIQKDEPSKNTKEQLAEFDSILESKFNKSPSSVSSSSSLEDGSSVSTTTKMTTTTTTTTTTYLIVSQEHLSSPSPSSSSLSSPSSSSSSSCHSFPKPSAKPQEDPVTLKRIQQILDDYNEQIRKTPDLQNRPAPRRRASCQSSELHSFISGDGGPSSSLPKKRSKIINHYESLNSESFSSSSLLYLGGKKIQEQPQQQQQIQQIVLLSKGKRNIHPLFIHQSQNNSNRSPHSRAFLSNFESSLDSQEDSGNENESHSPTSSSSSSVSLSLSFCKERDESPKSPPGLGIPLEMTPCQIMEAELSIVSSNEFPSSPHCTSSNQSSLTNS